MNNFSNHFYSLISNEKITNKLNILDYKITSSTFNIIRLLWTLIILIISITSLPNYLWLVPFIVIIAYLLFEFIFLDINIARKNATYENDALEYFPILLLSLKGTRNVKKAIQVTNQVVDNSLTQEFNNILKEINLGKSFTEAIYIFQKKCPSELIGNILINLVSANKLGNNIDESVNIALDYIKEKNRRLVIAKYKNIPLKIGVITIIITFTMLIMLLIMIKL